MAYRPLAEEERRLIHEGALGVLEDVGLKAPRPLLEKLREGGLAVGDAAAERLLLDRASVEAALGRAPRSVRLGARGAGHGLLLDGSRTHVAPDGCGSKTLDLDTGAVRPAQLADVSRSARLTDALAEFNLYWTMVSAQDVPREQRVGSEYLAALRNTVKHVQMIDVARREEAEALVGMARVLAEQGVVEGPPLSALISVVSPLRIDPDGTEAALTLAAAGLPIVCCSMPIASVTAPATPAGCLLLAHAECLALVTILQTLHPGTPVIYCSFASFADPRTGATNYEDPRSAWTAAAAAQLGRSLGIPCFSSAGPLAMLAGPDLTSGGGLLETSTLLSYEQMVIDSEAMRDARLAAAAPGLDPEALAVDVIREVGPGGHFMSRKHTVRHIREFVVARFSGADREAARREARRLIEGHEVPPLPPAADAALARIASAPASRLAR
jgi:trimethylamine---corrinoid protein Co-methyltransferase